MNTYAFFQLNSAADAETAAKLVGTALAKVHTAQTLAGVPTGATSSRLVFEFKFHPDRIKFQEVGQAILLNKNRGTAQKIAVRRSKL